MNFKIMGRFNALILTIEAAFMVPALLVCLLYRETRPAFAFLLSILLALAAAGIQMLLSKGARASFYAREGLVCVGLGWLTLSIFGSFPFFLSGEIPHFIDALFEIVSGFTTTGASILPDVERLSRGLLYWRSFSHWLGGMGVLVFLLAIVPSSGGNTGFTMHILRAESPGPNVGKLVPRMKQTAMILYVLYIFLTILNVVFLLLGRMPLFDAICTAFGTAGTGGFGIRNDSIAGYSPYLQNVCTVFMLLFGVNFSCYYLILLRRFRSLLQDEELRLYAATVVFSTALIAWNLRGFYATVGETVRHAAFQVASIITTTGFATADFDRWPSFSKAILLCLMVIGACAGSTGGGIKVSRFISVFKTVKKELDSYIHPKSVKKIKMDGKPIEHDVVRSINVYFITFILLFCVSMLLVSFEGHDLTTNFTAVLATINNIGPGLNMVGPAENFGFFKPFTKYVLMFDMLAGRLELFPLLILLHPALWKQALKRPSAWKKRGGK